jgi:hypothetical protein
MLDSLPPASESPLFSYIVASADMRFTEVSQREIYLRQDAQMGLIVRGEISGCGEGCHANLSQIFLEYAMSCEGCRDQDEAYESTTRFGERLGSALAARLAPGIAGLPPIDQLSVAFQCLLNSMNVPFRTERTAGRLFYTLAYCPFCESARQTGINREELLAYWAYVALCGNMLRSLAPDWALLQPSEPDTDTPVLKIEIAWL